MSSSAAPAINARSNTSGTYAHVRSRRTLNRSRLLIVVRVKIATHWWTKRWHHGIPVGNLLCLGLGTSNGVLWNDQSYLRSRRAGVSADEERELPDEMMAVFS